jgi:hypothetical protein
LPPSSSLVLQHPKYHLIIVIIISETTFGIRTITYDKDTGIHVNGQKNRVQGVVGQLGPLYYNIRNRI